MSFWTRLSPASLHSHWTTHQTRQAQLLRDDFVRNARAAKPGARYWLTQLLALLIFALYLSVVLWSLWALWRAFNPLHVGYLFFGGLALGLVWLARPTFGRLPREHLTPEQAPELHTLMQEISALLHGLKRVHVTLDASFNAFMTTVGVPPATG